MRFLFIWVLPIFSEYNKLRRKEAEAITSEKIKGGVWRSRTVSLLQNHQFHTSFCQDLLNKTKEENLKAMTSLHGEKHLNKHPHSESHHLNNLNNFPGNRHGPACGTPTRLEIQIQTSSQRSRDRFQELLFKSSEFKRNGRTIRPSL